MTSGARQGGRLAALADRTPLRVRLVAALVALAALGLLVTGVGATAALRGYLLERVDLQLASTTSGFAERFPDGPGRDGDGQDGPRLPALSVNYTQLTTADGQVVEALVPPLRDGQALPDLPPLDLESVVERRGRPFTVPAQGGASQWRALAVPLDDGSGSITVATPLSDVSATVTRLAVLLVVVSGVVLLLLAALAHAVVRSSLRPLGEVETTAAAIAAGDLAQRVPERDPATEVGRLAAAFNRMVARIESAFRAQQESETAARASEERMRRFVADASHELRTPLTSIRGFAELFRQGAASSPEDVARIMRRVEDEAARMGLLVEDLLLLARLDQQRPLERAPVDLLPLAADAVQDARALERDRPVDLVVAQGADVPVVLGDESRLRQVLGNLVSNALRHTPAGTPVRVGVRTEDGDAVLEVSDDGPGIAPDDAARVFERFFRTDKARTRALGGTGLGLSIVAALVAAHGGSVDLDTAPGAGATFRVRLPLAHPGGAADR